MFLQQRQQITICLTAAAMVAAFVFGRFLPLRNAAGAVEQTASQQRLIIQKGTTDAAQSRNIQKQLDEVVAEMDQYESGIAHEGALGSFLGEIAALMDKHALKDQQVNPGQQVEAGGLKCIPLTMKCTGPFTAVFDFFTELQKLDRFTRIEQVKLTNNETLDGFVQMNTKAVIFYRTNTSPNEKSK